MIQNIYKTYKKLLDVKLKDSTFLVIIISFLILLVGIITPSNKMLNAKSNIEFKNTVEINGKKYRVYFEEIK